VAERRLQPAVRVPGSRALTVREARGSDAEALASLLTELGYPDEPARVAARAAELAADAASIVLVAEDGAGVIGFVAASAMPLLHEDGSWCRLSALAVAEGRRGEGVGRALVEAAETFARSRGCRYAEVTSGDRPEREAAHLFYRALGYEEVSRRFLKDL
jgi:predicted N-acetyltransferase YhbS